MRTTIGRLIGAGLATSALSLGLVAPVAITAAAAAPAAPSPGAKPHPSANPDRARLMCARVPNLQARVDRLLARLEAGADRPGSVAWLKQRAERARADGRTELATRLDHRVTARSALIPVLRDRQQRLPEVAKWCQDHGFGTGK